MDILLELKEAEIMRERLSLAQEVSPYVGKYYFGRLYKKKSVKTKVMRI